ncbi:hypothetical protein D3C86_793250 [compost metagenome]
MPQSSETQFFASSENLDVLRRFSRDLRDVQDREIPQIEARLLEIIELMMSGASLFDKYCASNIEWIGTNFMDTLQKFPRVGADRLSNAQRHEHVVTTFIMAYRFLSELEFQQAEPSVQIQQIGHFIDDNLEMFSPRARQMLTYARYAMPVAIAKRLLNDPTIGEFRKLSQALDTAEKLKTDWDAELNERRAHVDAISDGLKQATASFNFVGLVNGFRQMASKKNLERQVSFWSLIALAIVMVTPPSIQIGFVIAHMDDFELKRVVLLYTLPTIVAIELILIYLFRVVLAQFRSVKAQILQLDLRIALCQFIQSYAEYAVQMKKDDPEVLSKFEAVVFSSLVPDSEGIPSTFDGVEQLSNLIKSFRTA